MKIKVVLLGTFSEIQNLTEYFTKIKFHNKDLNQQYALLGVRGDTTSVIIEGNEVEVSRIIATQLDTYEKPKLIQQIKDADTVMLFNGYNYHENLVINAAIKGMEAKIIYAPSHNTVNQITHLTGVVTKILNEKNTFKIVLWGDEIQKSNFMAAVAEYNKRELNSPEWIEAISFRGPKGTIIDGYKLKVSYSQKETFQFISNENFKDEHAIIVFPDTKGNIDYRQQLDAVTLPILTYPEGWPQIDYLTNIVQTHAPLNHVQRTQEVEKKAEPTVIPVQADIQSVQPTKQKSSFFLNLGFGTKQTPEVQAPEQEKSQQETMQISKVKPQEEKGKIKMVLWGDRDGKSNFRNILQNFLGDLSKMTIGIDFMTLWINGYQVQIWDTAGQESFRTITAAYLKDTQAVILFPSDQDHMKQLDSIDENIIFTQNSPIKDEDDCLKCLKQIVNKVTHAQVHQEDMKVAEKSAPEAQPQPQPQPVKQQASLLDKLKLGSIFKSKQVKDPEVNQEQVLEKGQAYEVIEQTSQQVQEAQVKEQAQEQFENEEPVLELKQGSEPVVNQAPGKSFNWNIFASKAVRKIESTDTEFGNSKATSAQDWAKGEVIIAEPQRELNIRGFFKRATVAKTTASVDEFSDLNKKGPQDW